MSGLHQFVIEAVQTVRRKIRWKPGKDHQHLQKRIRRGHLPSATTLDEYEAIIKTIVTTPKAEVLIYTYGGFDYPTIVANINGRPWLAMFNMQGIMETAFPPDDPVEYFAKPYFKRLGRLEELER